MKKKIVALITLIAFTLVGCNKEIAYVSSEEGRKLMGQYGFISPEE